MLSATASVSMIFGAIMLIGVSGVLSHPAMPIPVAALSIIMISVVKVPEKDLRSTAIMTILLGTLSG